LCAQLEQMVEIDTRRKQVFQRYMPALAPLQAAGLLRLPVIPVQCQPNAHIFYVLTKDATARVELQRFLAARGVQASTHYVPLHSSPFGKQIARTPFAMPVTDDVTARLLRLPLYHALTAGEVEEVIAGVLAFYGG
jgi:dTDP-4-amino-4,6-dideoxygalactose transaminase